MMLEIVKQSHPSVSLSVSVGILMNQNGFIRLYDFIGEPFPWATRMRVAVGAASGLAFLHSPAIQVTYQILTRDDILLDGVSS